MSVGSDDGDTKERGRVFLAPWPPGVELTLQCHLNQINCLLKILRMSVEIGWRRSLRSP